MKVVIDCCAAAFLVFLNDFCRVSLRYLSSKSSCSCMILAFFSRMYRASLARVSSTPPTTSSANELEHFTLDWSVLVEYEDETLNLGRELVLGLRNEAI
jgi:hypothetical protein